MTEPQLYVPYCGTAPIPAELWTRWNLDPLPILALAVMLVAWLAYKRAQTQPETGDSGNPRYFIAGWLALALALISPLCNLSVALFSARVSQHMFLVLVAAPLLVVGGALSVLSRTRAARIIDGLSQPLTATALFAAALWLWHLPRAYQATFQSDLVYWLMHLTLTGSALLLWQALLLGARQHVIARLFCGFATLLQMGLLGALITLAPRPLYPAHRLTTEAWNLSPLEDQQLGGLIMWIPGCTVLTVFVLCMFGKFLLQGQEPATPGRRAHSRAPAG